MFCTQFGMYWIEMIEKNTGIKVISWNGDKTFYGHRNGTSNKFLLAEGYRESAFSNFKINEKSYHIIILKTN